MLVSASFIFNSQIDNLKKQIDKIYFGNFIPVKNLQNISMNFKDMIICLQNEQKLCSLKSLEKTIKNDWQYYFKAYKTEEERKVVNAINEDFKTVFMDYNPLKYSLMIEKINFLIDYEVSSANHERKSFLNKYTNMKELLFYNILALGVLSLTIIAYIIYSLIKKDNKLQLLNKKYKHQSITDSMTGLFNRGYFDAIFDNIPSISNSNRWKTAFIMFDIDYFKQYNDTYGHDLGDETLKKVAQVLKNYFNKEYEYVFRLGGEEFGAILFDIDEEILEQCLEEVKKEVNNLKIEHSTSEVEKFVTLSMGAIIYKAGDNLSPNRLYKKADENLYNSKKNGRNQYTI